MRVSLGVPTYSHVCIETTLCLMHLLRATPVEFHLNFHKGTYLNELRNDILKDAREAEADYLMFIDTDIMFPGDGLNRLLSHDKDVIGAIYNVKSLPPVSTVKLAGPDGKFISAGQQSIEVPRDKIFKVAGLPTGFMLIRLKAIESLKTPFEFKRNDDGTLVGEDIHFCMECSKLGLDLWCDPSIQIGHIGQYVY